MRTDPPTRRRLGSTELEVYPLWLGGNVFGWTANETQSFDLLDRYRAAGGNGIDTADVYQRWVPGHTGFESETVIGRWLTARRCRDEMLIATKVGGPAKEAARAALFEPNGTPRLDGTLRDLRVRVEGCLRRLQTDHIDLLYAHMDDYSRPMEEYLTEFDALVVEGKVRYLAAANFGPERLQAALRVSARLGTAPFTAVQMRYNLLERAEYERSFASIVHTHQLGFVPYWALAKGFLTGKYRARAGRADLSERASLLKVDAYARHPRAERVLDTIADIAQRRAVTPAAVAVSWLLHQDGVTSPAVSARTTRQLDEILCAANLQLDPDDVKVLDEVSAEVQLQPNTI